MPTAAPPAEVTVPSDLTTVEDPAELDTYLEHVLAALDDIAVMESPTPEDVARATDLAATVEAITTEQTRRRDEADQTRSDLAAQVARARAATGNGDAPAADDGAPTGADGTPASDAPADAPAPPVDAAPAGDAPAPAAEPVAASARPPVTVPAQPRRPSLNRALADIATNAPRPELAPPRPELVLTAAAGIPGVPMARIESPEALAEAWASQATNMGVTSGNPRPMPVMNVARSFEHTIGEQASLNEVGGILDRLMAPTRSRAGMEALVAAGGWCAPSEIDYSFFDIAGVSGTWDVPTVGIRRGGLQWPISLGLDQFFALSGAPASGISSASTMPWLWTEVDDILAVTGSGAKLCLRPPCPDFDEERLDAMGLCVLAGNLTEAAYPELIRHFIGLTMVAHERIMNRRAIALAVAHSTVDAYTMTVGDVVSATTALLGGAELAATDMRTKLGMPSTGVIEYVLPLWVLGVMRSDLAKRNGWDDISVTDAWLAQQFDARGIRVQFVEDWQTLPGTVTATTGIIGRAGGNVTWPSSVLGLMYPAGHYFKGNGFSLNLGVVRDSTLNEQNDHTAAWSEESMLIGARGNEARLLTTSLCPSGMTGAQATSAPSTCGV